MAHCIPTYMLASGLMAAGMNWWQALVDDPARQLDRPRPDPPQLAPRHEVRHPLPGLRARLLRHDRLEPSGAHAGDRGVRMVRDPGLDRRRGAQHALHGARPRMEGAPRRGPLPGSHPDRVALLPRSSGDSTSSIIYRGMDLLRKVENWAAPFVLVMTAALLVWAIRQANGLGPLLAQPGKLPHVLGVLPGLRSVADRDDRFLGDALAQHAGLHALRAESARADRRPGRRAADDDVRLRRDGRSSSRARPFSSSASPSGIRSSSSRSSGLRSWSRSRCSPPSSRRSR